MPPLILRGAQSLPLNDVISAPIISRGVMIRLIGLDCIDSSPFNSLVKLHPDKIPLMSRVVVPLFPTSSTLFGAFNPYRPLPWMTT